jgi:hypothetical protein
MAPGGKAENGGVMRFGLLSLALALLSGCETLNDAVVRQWFRDSGLSRRISNQIREGLEIREDAPPATLPAIPAPPFLDEG